ncbi:MAG TPA: hypothetical protein VH081_11430 [Solirubrobacteraceae bacterium]|jgi:hypothetical protein|nr:hypothetical protein [Solirubrobacteraceae bacterium]
MIRRVSIALVASALLAGCAQNTTKQTLLAKISDPALACFARHTPKRGSFSVIRSDRPPGKRSPLDVVGNDVALGESTESVVVNWPSGESLTAWAFSSARTAQAALAQLRREPVEAGANPRYPDRRGGIVVGWSKAPGAAEAAVLGEC